MFPPHCRNVKGKVSCFSNINFTQQSLLNIWIKRQNLQNLKAHFHSGKFSAERKFCKMWLAVETNYEVETFNNDIFGKFSVRGNFSWQEMGLCKMPGNAISEGLNFRIFPKKRPRTAPPSEHCRLLLSKCILLQILLGTLWVLLLCSWE
jgi:hypothetical protein